MEGGKSGDEDEDSDAEDGDWELKANGPYATMGETQADEHANGKPHKERVAEGRAPPDGSTMNAYMKCVIAEPVFARMPPLHSLMMSGEATVGG